MQKVIMNILYHHRTQGRGAEGVHIAFIIKGLRDLGHHVSVISPTGEDPEETAGGSVFTPPRGIRGTVFRFISRHMPQLVFELFEILYNLPAGLKLNRALRKTDIDFIYERNAFFLWAGARAAEKHDLPFVVEVNEIAGHKRVRGQVLVSLAVKIERYVFQIADAIIVVSPFLKREIEALGIDGDKIYVVPNGADPELFSPKLKNAHLKAQHDIEEETMVVGFIGWFVGWHKVEHLIDAFARVCKGKNARLLIIGDGNLKEEYIAAAERAGIAGQLIMPGAVPYEDVPEYISIMDICVIPASNQYRSPIKLFEYMAMEKPVLAPRLEPIEDVVEHMTHAYLFEPDDVDSLTEGLRILNEHTLLRYTMGQRARMLVLERHTWKKNARRVIDAVYTS